MTLAKGSKGPEVEKLQRALNVRLRIFEQTTLKVDGDFGDKTEKALIVLFRTTQVSENMLVRIAADAAIQQSLIGNTEGKPHPLRIAQRLVDNDQRIFQYLLRCQHLLARAKAAGKNMQAAPLAARLAMLSTNYTGRQKRLREHAAAGEIKIYTSYPAELKPLVDKYAISGTVGFIPLWVAVGAIFFAGSAAALAIYTWMLPDYESSAKELIIIPELEKALASLTPEEREKVEQDLQKQKDDAYYAGKLKQQQSGGGLFGSMKTIGLFFLLGVVLAPKVFGGNAKSGS